MSVVNFTPRPI